MRMDSGRFWTLGGAVLALELALIGAATPLTAQHQHHMRSAYAGAGSDTVKTLTPQEVAGLLGGEGMGLARPAELNGYPGPRHVLDMADSLALTPEQVERTEAVFQAMHDRAVEIGRAIVDAEKGLDAGFAEGADPAVLQDRVTELARLRGELRWIHLRAHFETAEILTLHQRHTYDRLRGYR